MILRFRGEKSKKGFTIIELSIVLVITGILATLAVTTYSALTKKAKRVQAKIALKHLAKAEYIYFSEHDSYTDDSIVLDFDPIVYDYYTISVDASQHDFTGKAEGNLDSDSTLDTWVIHKDGDPVSLILD